MIQIKRVYSSKSSKDGRRILVDRLWPRGISKKKAGLTGWAKEAAPSRELRDWFGHDPEKWDGFQKRYAKELSANRHALLPLLEAAKHGTLTLLFAAKDPDHNNAVFLKKYLEARIGR